MQYRPILTLLLVTTFLAAAAGAALAQPEQSRAPDRDARAERMAALHEARNASLASFKENRSAALEDYQTSINATRVSFLENKTRIKDECATMRNDTEGSEHSKCMQDGLKPLIEQARAAHKDAREALKARLLDARENAKASFAAVRNAHADRSG